MQKNKIKKIILSGGGTGGSVTPLLAISGILKERGLESADYEFLWIGTKTGPERELVESSGIKFRAIFSGKLRRYWSWQNIFDLFKIKLGFFQAFFIIKKEKPDLVISAGSFVSVPVAWAAWILRVPILIQQLDVRPGLANKLMAPFAKKVLVTFKKSLTDYGSKAVLAGNPVRKELIEVKISKREAMQKIGFLSDKPVILVIGGGTGATAINKLVLENIEKLTRYYQILHVTGRTKAGNLNINITKENVGYKYFEFLDTFGLIKAYAASDLIISRAGMGMLTELSYIAKPAIIIPMPDSHQEENAVIFESTEAAIVLKQKELDGEKLLAVIKQVVSDENLRNKLKQNIKKVINTECDEIFLRVIKDLIV